MQGFVIYGEPNSAWNEAFDDITTWIKQVNSISLTLKYQKNGSGILKSLSHMQAPKDIHSADEVEYQAWDVQQKYIQDGNDQLRELPLS